MILFPKFVGDQHLNASRSTWILWDQSLSWEDSSWNDLTSSADSLLLDLKGRGKRENEQKWDYPLIYTAKLFWWLLLIESILDLIICIRRVGFYS